jgi:hypothetical protein
LNYDPVQEKLDCLIREDGTDRFFRNVGTKLPFYATYNPKRVQISGINEFETNSERKGSEFLVPDKIRNY